jgi:hypothetical protein
MRFPSPTSPIADRQNLVSLMVPTCLYTLAALCREMLSTEREGMAEMCYLQKQGLDFDRYDESGIAGQRGWSLAGRAQGAITNTAGI